MKLGPRQKSWLAALESGEYEQCREYLKVDDAYCCLGIACELAGAKASLLDGCVTSGYTAFENILTTMPHSVIAYYGFHTDNGHPLLGETIEDTPEGLCLSDLNDKGATFTQIASIVRRFPDLYFKEPK